jgi:hypothetical protein
MKKVMTYTAIASFLIVSSAQADICDNLKPGQKGIYENFQTNMVKLQKIVEDASKMATDPKATPVIMEKAKKALDSAIKQMERNSTDRDAFVKKNCK